MKLTLDAGMLNRTTQDAVRRLRAVRSTVEKAGGGEVLVSKRTKLPGEKGRALHGRGIANLLADRGRDVFAYPARETDAVSADVAQGTAAAIQRAWATGAHQQPVLRALFTKGAEDLAAWAKRNLLAGGLGGVAEKTKIAKQRLVRRGRALAAFVNVFGVRSGRFAGAGGNPGIRARWRGGRRAAG